MLFVGTSIIHPSTEGVFLLCNILDLLIYSSLLVNHGISVDECTVTKESLEDYFNEKMRGGIVNA